MREKSRTWVNWQKWIEYKRDWKEKNFYWEDHKKARGFVLSFTLAM